MFIVMALSGASHFIGHSVFNVSIFDSIKALPAEESNGDDGESGGGGVIHYYRDDPTCLLSTELTYYFFAVPPFYYQEITYIWGKSVRCAVGGNEACIPEGCHN